MSQILVTTAPMSATLNGEPGSAYLEVIHYEPTEPTPAASDGFDLARPLGESKCYVQGSMWNVPHFYGSGGSVQVPATAFAGLNDDSLVQFLWHFRPADSAEGSTCCAPVNGADADAGGDKGRVAKS